MKTFLLALVWLCYGALCAAGTVNDRLKEVNAQWQFHTMPARFDLASANQTASAYEWIGIHLDIVEKRLRQAGTAHLSARQLLLRMQCLDQLRQYQQEGRFPINLNGQVRQPVFIDSFDNFCAVGYLVRQSGYEALARKIASTSNYAYVKEMNFPELMDWAGQHGFSLDELAWIQPSYPPAYYTSPLANGVMGNVYELLVSIDGSKLYVGGAFSLADAACPSDNIAYITRDGNAFTWHCMNGGTDGPVHALVEINDQLIAAGNFGAAGNSGVNNVAHWTGSEWEHTGCIRGTVQDLIVYKETLFAAGAFDVCSILGQINFARWNGNIWQPLLGISGKVNSMHIVGDDLLLGGSFELDNKTANIVRWNAANGFSTFAYTPPNEVNALVTIAGRVYAGCTAFNDDAGTLLWELEGQTWKPVLGFRQAQKFSPYQGKLEIKTLIADAGDILVAGTFQYKEGATLSLNAAQVKLDPKAVSDAMMTVDNSIHKMTVFQNDLIIGGSFQMGKTPVTSIPVALNGLARREAGLSKYRPALQQQEAQIFPIPAKAGGTIEITNNINATDLTLIDILGRKMIHKAVLPSGKNVLQLPHYLPCGMYWLQIRNNQQQRLIRPVSVY